MKVLLRDRKTNLYLQGEDEWSSRRELARDFGRSAAAAVFAMHHRLREVEALLVFDAPEFDIVLPLGPSPDGPRPEAP